MKLQTFDPIWEAKYSAGQKNLYPWDMVVSFVFRNYPRNKPRNEVKILEIGCGTGSNLWFAAREGFNVSGIDGSSSAITSAQDRFTTEGLTGDLRVGDFTQLPFESNSFDLVFDRGSLTCCGFTAGQQAVAEVKRVLLPGGKFLCNPYSDSHSSYVSGQEGNDGLRTNITSGTLIDVGGICFYGRRQLDNLFKVGWKVLSMNHLELVEQIQPQYTVHAEWRIIAEKVVSSAA
ncbi:class I SAM-dependent methyltransferase [Moorena producens]|uniref:class I SAM-dependent methyltransferase n=1 Tax=Moorena producens TaxID=1155739 RepID=UPI003C78A188